MQGRGAVTFLEEPKGDDVAAGQEKDIGAEGA
jgi:hypothetical protein